MEGLNASTKHVPENLQLVIKNPSGSVSDFQLEVSSFYSVENVKERIHEKYPEKPAPGDQKLIFAGRILSNDALLLEVFKQHELSQPQTLHLVISQSSANPAPSPPSSSSSNTIANTSGSSSAPSSSPAVPNMDVPADISHLPPHIQQMAASYGVYAQMQMMQMMQYAMLTGGQWPGTPGAGGAAPNAFPYPYAYPYGGVPYPPVMYPPAGLVPHPAGAVPPTYAPPQATGHQPAGAGHQPMGGAAPAAAGLRMRIPWGGGGHQQPPAHAVPPAPAHNIPPPPAGAPPQRLGRGLFQPQNLQLLAKIAMLVFFVCYQDNSERALMVVVFLAVIVYLHETGRLGFLRRLAPRIQQRGPQVAPPPNPAADIPGVDNPQQQVPPQSPFSRIIGFIIEIRDLVLAFFSSLIPSWQPLPAAPAR
mmetsp:Transcript_763/g.1254  ORF Transcript_763/g.1254 Transcript_763/m.1254 type:complete len:419 (+) Transcript_763:73-1329(+)|eukprot:CAMPEP_0184335802 /NCGR_PEP_ID=MMETSP1089-20130417/4308_1 /TAXON_ID=38269 ORGANISM="Gloeochaete wittrockiana, Strain SAG46.84" /NCGR_SAMPLE_ID=MMETSP1089 /ASSEMBLY_ACC=CAM_ASM_000445 /LENGTH=418 /DNA_ID=CAMNT_0026660645 /DNA_START=68 /DNA_END=1324 /DNA_ORIENTATION=+